MERILCLITGYVFGLIQTGYIYGVICHVDIRKHGSGNAGTTNALRTLGWKAGAVTFLGDCLKCIAAVFITGLIFKDHHDVELLRLYAGLGVVLGHNFPFYLRFKGGKGIASTFGLIITIHPAMFLIAAVIFAAIVLITKYVSLASITIMLVFAAEAIIYGQAGGLSLSGAELHEYYAIVIILALLGIWRHRSNIKRLLAGTENKTYITKIGKKKE